ncbi:hypothetical protein IPdc08_01892 [archaeon]|nr:hypothetical protein IPdc08_01892 [archaeon]
MHEITDESKLASIGRAIGAVARNLIIKKLKGRGWVPLADLTKELVNYQYTVIKNHCKILSEEGFIELKTDNDRYIVRLIRVPNVYIEEVKKRK